MNDFEVEFEVALKPFVAAKVAVMVAVPLVAAAATVHG